MAVGLDIGIRAQGIEKPLAGIGAVGMQVGVLPPPGGGGGFSGQPVEKVGIEDADSAHHAADLTKKRADGKQEEPDPDRLKAR